MKIRGLRAELASGRGHKCRMDPWIVFGGLEERKQLSCLTLFWRYRYNLSLPSNFIQPIEMVEVLLHAPASRGGIQAIWTSVGTFIDMLVRAASKVGEIPKDANSFAVV